MRRISFDTFTMPGSWIRCFKLSTLQARARTLFLSEFNFEKCNLILYIAFPPGKNLWFCLEWKHISCKFYCCILFRLATMLWQMDILVILIGYCFSFVRNHEFYKKWLFSTKFIKYEIFLEDLKYYLVGNFLSFWHT